MPGSCRCQSAEHKFAGVPCGLMDQAVSAGAKEGCTLLIDCESKETEAIPLNDPNIAIVVCNSNMKHSLSGSEYPDRVKQCQLAVAAVSTARAAKILLVGARSE